MPLPAQPERAPPCTPETEAGVRPTWFATWRMEFSSELWLLRRHSDEGNDDALTKESRSS